MDVRWSRILKKLGIEPATRECFRFFIASLNTVLEYSEDRNLDLLRTWDAPVLPNLGCLSPDEVRCVEAELSKAEVSIDECQVRVQKLIPRNRRKGFAAYYTTDEGTGFMASLTRKYLERFKKHGVVLADPFLGSGRTLTCAIRKIGTEKLRGVWGVEPLALPALVAYASLLRVLGGRRELVRVLVGDAFKLIPGAFSPFTRSDLPRADIILTNPPFTRWKYLERGFRQSLLRVASGLGYGDYITRREASLQTLSMFLADHVLNDGGLIVSVLPASTFYTIYGRGYKSLLRKNYDVLAVVECLSKPSFSEDSGFKEVIVAAVKGGNRKGQTVFAGLDNNVEGVAETVVSKRKPGYGANMFNIRELPRFLDINWLALFGKSELRDIMVRVFNVGLRKGTLGYWNSVLGRESIIRGVEMYGPEFFFIPNKHWFIAEEGEEFVKIEDCEGEVRLTLDKELLVKTLRKPSLYSRIIEARVDSYMLSIPPVEPDDLPEDLREYMGWGIRSGAARPAINAYGRYWYSHVHRQILSKKPFGRVFIPDKVDLMFRRRGVFANHTAERVAASKNFYIIRDGNEAITKLLVSWFNCTFFFSTLVLLGRKISETWTRFLEDDYLQLPVINPDVVDEQSVRETCKSVDSILDKPLPPFWEQLGEEYRFRLDYSLAEAIGIESPEETVNKLHQTLFDHQFRTQ